MDGMPSTYCSTCKGFRAIKDWHERRDILVIELEPCGHVARRTARLEWLGSGRARARRRAMRSVSLSAMEKSGAR